jgi:hypothetical protein
MTIMMKKNRSLKLIIAGLCILLAASIGFISPVQLIAKAAEPVYYVEDIKIYAGEGKSKAKKYFDGIGYITANIDLNADTDTGKDAWLGYKLTTNKDMAITDIRIMGMDTGYQLYDYNALIEYLKAQNSGTAQRLFKLSKDFAEKYKAGSPKAKDAYDGLNLFYVDDDNKTKLGDYIVSGKATLDFFTQLIVKAGTGTANAVIGYLNIGIAPFENEYDEETGGKVTTPWAQLVEKSEIWDMLESNLSKDEENALHQQYNDLARDLFKQIQDFTTMYQNAAARLEANGGKYKNELEMDNMDEAYEGLNDMDADDSDLVYISAFNVLNTYHLNDETMLGDWFVSIGLQTSDDVDLKQLYPVIDAMGNNQAAAAIISGFSTAVNNLCENTQSEDMRDMLKKAKNKIKEYNGADALNVFENCDDEIEGKTIGFTNDAIRKHQAEFNLGKMSRYEIVKNKINEIIGYVNLAMGAVYVGVYVLAAVATIGLIVTKFVFSSLFIMQALNWTFMMISTVCTYVNMAMAWIGPAVLAISIGLMIGFWIGGMLRDKHKDLHHSDKPDYVFDAPDSAEGVLTIKYKSVLDDDGDVADINRGKQWKWTLLAYSTDLRVGSPIRADKDGNVFKILKGNANFVAGYDCAKFFGERNAGDVNTFCEDSGSFYLHYRTEDSIAESEKADDPGFYEITDDNGEEKTDAEQTADDTDDTEEESADKSQSEKKKESVKYLGDIILCIGKDAEEAKAKITKHDGAHYIFDYNFTKDQKFATYIGYSITTDPDEAITDLRVAPYSGQTLTFTYGDIKYTYIEILGIDTGLGEEQTRPKADGLFFTKDKHAGDPILADGLYPVKKASDAKEGWIPVSFFGCDLPYNFDTDFSTSSSYGLSQSRFDYSSGHKSTHSFTNYRTYGNHDLNDKPKVYLYYESSKKYTSGTKYLSGMFFGGGYDTTNNKRKTGEILQNVSEMTEYYVGSFKNIGCCSVNLAKSYSDRTWNSMMKNFRQNLYYTWTYNPKRAVTNIAVYQGDTFSETLPYSMTKPLDGVTQNFLAATVIQQGYTDSGDWVARYVSPFNCYMRCDGMIINEGKFWRQLMRSYTTDLPEGIQFGYKNMRIPVTGLYICGPMKDRQALRLSDVIVTDKAFSYKEDNGKIVYTIPNSNGRTQVNLEGNNAQGSFKPICELKDPNRAKPFNLSYPRVYSNDGDDAKLQTEASSLYIYIRGEKTVKGKYISSVSVGSFSRAQYKESNPKAKGDELKEIDEVTESQAMIGALSGCSDEIIIRNFSLANQNDAWYNKTHKTDYGYVKSSMDAPENKPAAYIGVSRTDSARQAITGVVLYELNDTVAPNQITLDKADYFCAGVKAPIYMDGKTYFLYYTRNTGVSPGKPIEDITIDSTPLVIGSATNLCADKDHTVPYGNPDQTSFIHLKYTKTSEFFTKLYIGKGSTKNAAAAELLSQGCVEMVDCDLNTGVKGDTILLGYRSAALDTATLESKAAQSEEKWQTEYAKQTQEAIYDIIVTSGEPFHAEGIVRNNIYYTPVGTSSLKADFNDWEGYELYMYYASPYYSQTYNTKNNAKTALPQDVYTGYITHLAFTESDRVPYNSSVSSSSGQSVCKWEYIMKADNSDHVDLNEGAVCYRSPAAVDIRVSMFAQRIDGSVKPAGEITGGFVDSKYKVGELKFS